MADWHSALMIIVNGETDEHLDMLEGGVIRQLLNDKWKTFARVSWSTLQQTGWGWMGGGTYSQ